MKKFFIFLLVAVVVVIGVLMCQGTVVQESGDGSQVTGDYRSTDSLPMLITQIRKCSKLYTAEYEGIGAAAGVQHQAALGRP